MTKRVKYTPFCQNKSRQKTYITSNLSHRIEVLDFSTAEIKETLLQYVQPCVAAALYIVGFQFFLTTITKTIYLSVVCDNFKFLFLYIWVMLWFCVFY